MESILQDIRYAVRILKRSPGFVLIAALTIALGIAATTTIFSIVNAVLLRPPPGIQDAGKLVRIYRIAEDGSSYNKLSYPNYRDYRDGETGPADGIPNRFLDDRPVPLRSSSFERRSQDEDKGRKPYPREAQSSCSHTTSFSRRE